MGIKASSLRGLLHRAHALFRALLTDTGSPVYLPNELVSDILSRIPERSVRRFRCVSKEWHALVTAPAFVAAHKFRAEPFLVMYSNPSEGLRLIDMDGNVVRLISDMCGCWSPVSTSPDGILCVTGYLDSYPGNAVFAGLIDLGTMEAVVTRLEDNKAWGFGRAIPSDAYKIVRFRDHIRGCNCEVYTIGGGDGWRRRKSHPLHYKYDSFENYAATVNGVLYLLARKKPHDMDYVLCFDLESEEWKNNIKGPSNVDIWGHDISLGELKDTLYMAEKKNWETDHGYTNIWLLTDFDTSIWIKAYTIPLEPSMLPYAPMFCRMIPLRVLHDSSKLLFYYGSRYVLFVLRGAQLQIYDPHNETCTDVTEKLLGDHGTVVGFCSSHLERFGSAKIQRPISSFRHI
ncbi:hypothetical protein CFC21_111275 [Triticum aestivum]|uniref:F-box domain-containing protein n=2 Tax=Triticum aestivum TaxID=4565 RepID=A0A9R1MPU5_WHEAT|nr:hypothetical protein CFC21_111275 [Triticum aestivum]